MFSAAVAAASWYKHAAVGSHNNALAVAVAVAVGSAEADGHSKVDDVVLAGVVDGAQLACQ